MDSEIQALLQGPFAPRENEGPSKVTSLEEALRRHVRPGMALHIGVDARAALCELARQWWGGHPRFTLVMSAVGDHALSLLHGGLVETMVASIYADLYLPPGPSPIVQRAFKDGVRFENWSLYTHLQRLQAAALGLEFLPTRSLLGTTMAKENASAFKEIADPFGGEAPVGLVKALAPDLSLVHAWAADPAGNAIGIPADGDSYWGARAARDGVIVTCERLVTTEFLRRHASQVTIPGYRVRAVAQAPFGAHPRALMGNGLPDFQGYGEDLPFFLAQRQAWKEPASYEGWVKEWVLEPRSHAGYLARLGEERLGRLRALAEPSGWRQAVEQGLEAVRLDQGYSPTEMMVIAAARSIQELVRSHGLSTILTGIGTTSLASWLAYLLLQERGLSVDLVIGTGDFGYRPAPGYPGMYSYANVSSSKMLSSTVDVYGAVLSGRRSGCLGTLGAAQVDPAGNLNSTRLANGMYLVGAGGAPDIAAGAQEILVMAPLSTRRYVEQVDYITVPGENTRHLVSDRGTFVKREGDQRFTLTALFPGSSESSLEEQVRTLRENCGWRSLQVADELSVLAAPTRQELGLLRLLDPEQSVLKG